MTSLDWQSMELALKDIKHLIYGKNKTSKIIFAEPDIEIRKMCIKVFNTTVYLSRERIAQICEY